MSESKKSLLKKSGGELKENADKAVKSFESRDVNSARKELIGLEKGAIKHLKKIDKLKQRLEHVLTHYEEKNRDLTRDVGSVGLKEQELEKQRVSIQGQLRLAENECSGYQRELNSAESNLNSACDRLRVAERKRREASDRRVAATVGALFLGIVTLGAGAPLAGAAAVGAGAAAVGAGAAALAFANQEKDAERDIRNYEKRVSSLRSFVSHAVSCISSLAGEVSSFDSQLSALTAQRQSYETERRHLEIEKGKVLKVVAFLMEAKTFWRKYSASTEQGQERTALLSRLTQRSNVYTLFDSKGTELVLGSFKEAWEIFEEMSENSSEYIFKMSFLCSQCNRSVEELPHLNADKPICSTCHASVLE